ncbi:MAG: MarP family serine protease, partial [Acidimicrobiia bacterium]|nr:MarP family serine protease [Acidimicrobiia bacterium]
MNLLDWILVGLLVVAVLAGYRLGLVARALSWAGLVAGLLLATRLLPVVLDRFETDRPGSRLLLALGVLLGGALLGQALGGVLGARLHLALPRATRPVDSVAGAAVGGLGVLVAVWLLLPAAAEIEGSSARLVRDSRIARAIDDAAPDPPDAVQTLRRLVDESGIPRVFDDLRRSPIAGPPPTDAGIDPEVLERVIASTVRVQGEACGRVQQGSGWVAERGVVVTNAHVVAGEDDTTVSLDGGPELDATAVHYDTRNDIAVLDVPGLEATPLALAQRPRRGTDAVVIGYPENGPLAFTPARLGRSGEVTSEDSYGR